MASTSAGPAPATLVSDRRARRRQRTREALVRAGERLLAAQGYHGTTVAQVAQAADVGVGTFYLHFRDKDDLAETIVRDGLLALKANLETRLAAVSPDQRPALLLTEILVFAKARLDLFRIALTTSGTVAVTLQAQSWLATQLAEALTASGAAGSAADDVRLTGRLVAGMVTQAIAWWDEHDDPAPEAMAARILALLGRSGEA